MNRIADAAAAIATARRGRNSLAPLPPALRPADAAEAYRVQDALHAALAPDLGAIVGHKIGCTTAVMQRYLKIDHPCAGGIFARTVHASGAALPYRGFVRVGVECEIAVRLGPGLSIESCMPAIELVDDRYVDWRQIDTATLIADDFFGAGLILGAPVPAADAPDLAQVVGTTAINGTPVGQGRGADVLGHPKNALDWLRAHAAARGRPLQAGDIVSTGSLVETRWLAPGDAVMVSLSGLGSVAVSLTP
jgi:2-keto-4-pentenoate hydratase